MNNRNTLYILFVDTDRMNRFNYKKNVIKQLVSSLPLNVAALLRSAHRAGWLRHENVFQTNNSGPAYRSGEPYFLTKTTIKRRNLEKFNKY